MQVLYGTRAGADAVSRECPDGQHLCGRFLSSCLARDGGQSAGVFRGHNLHCNRLPSWTAYRRRYSVSKLHFDLLTLHIHLTENARGGGLHR